MYAYGFLHLNFLTLCVGWLEVIIEYENLFKNDKIVRFYFTILGI